MLWTEMIITPTRNHRRFETTLFETIISFRPTLIETETTLIETGLK